MIPTFYDLWEYVQIRNRELARQRANRVREESMPEEQPLANGRACSGIAAGRVWRRYGGQHRNSVLFS
jgi:hypothetical protein